MLCAWSLIGYVTRWVIASHLFSLVTLDNNFKWWLFLQYDRISFEGVRSYLLFETSPNILSFNSAIFRSRESTTYNRSGLNDRCVRFLISYCIFLKMPIRIGEGFGYLFLARLSRCRGYRCLDYTRHWPTVGNMYLTGLCVPSCFDVRKYRNQFLEIDAVGGKVRDTLTLWDGNTEYQFSNNHLRQHNASTE
jgi:hypothetical protein